MHGRPLLTTLRLMALGRWARNGSRRLDSRLSALTQRALATQRSLPEKDCTSITPPYEFLLSTLDHVRTLLDNRPMTLAEKILYSHLHDPEKSLSSAGKIRGEAYLQLNPERVAMQDASAQ